MFSFHLFGPAPTLTRLEKCEELKQITAILVMLRKKELELSRAKASKGAGSTDYEKHTVISKLLTELDKEIAIFNGEAARELHEDEIRDMIKLVAAMKAVIMHTLDRNAATLNKFRDHMHENLSNVVNWSVFLTTMTALYMSPLSLLASVGVYIFGGNAIQKKMGSVIRDSTGLSEEDTRTMIILKGLQSTLCQIHDNLRHAIGEEFDAERERSESDSDDINDNDSGLLFLLSKPAQDYVDSLRDRKSNTDIIDALKLSGTEQEKFAEFLDPLLATVMNVPVMVDEQYFDLDTILKLPIDDNGQREQPFTRYKFFPRDIQPGRQVFNAIQEVIEVVKRERQESSVVVTMSPKVM